MRQRPMFLSASVGVCYAPCARFRTTLRCLTVNYTIEQSVPDFALRRRAGIVDVLLAVRDKDSLLAEVTLGDVECSR